MSSGGEVVRTVEKMACRPGCSSQWINGIVRKAKDCDGL